MENQTKKQINIILKFQIKQKFYLNVFHTYDYCTSILFFLIFIRHKIFTRHSLSQDDTNSIFILWSQSAALKVYLNESKCRNQQRNTNRTKEWQKKGTKSCNKFNVHPEQQIQFKRGLRAAIFYHHLIRFLNIFFSLYNFICLSLSILCLHIKQYKKTQSG